MSFLGTGSLYLALIASLVSIVSLAMVATSTSRQNKLARRKQGERDGNLALLHRLGTWGVWLAALALTVACVVIVVCLFSGDNTLQYVVQYRSDSTSPLAPLYVLSGLWAGKAGSLLFWAWLIALFNAVVAFRARKAPVALDTAALALAQVVLFAFIAILVFDESNYPFTLLPLEFLGANGELIGNAAFLGLNPLLEHWAMAIHPPALFIGYAGMTIPCAYALAALLVNDPSRAWVDRSSRYTLVSWLFLGIGIGLGSVWAYLELTFGGYWAWDAVENASLLSWLMGVALLHSMTIYRQRGAFKRWTIISACLTFAFVILGTFITRSGIISGSVHAFSSLDMVSLTIFGALIVLSVLAAIAGVIWRRTSFADQRAGVNEAESIFTKDVAYYLTNVVMLTCTLLITYMTLSTIWPSWLPYGGMELKALSYNPIARPVGVLFCLIIAVCPLLGWGHTNARDFLKNAQLPAVFAVIVFAGLCYLYLTQLQPNYWQTLADGGMEVAGYSAQYAPTLATMEAASTLLAGGPFWYYNALTLLGFLAASLLVFNSLMMLVRAFAKRNLRAQVIGGFLAHLAMGVILVGLIGSSMYTIGRSGYLPWNEEEGSSSSTYNLQGYQLSYLGNSVQVDDNQNDVVYTMRLSVSKDGEYVGEVSPSFMATMSSGFSERSYRSAVLSLPTEDLYVLYYGTNTLSYTDGTEEDVISLDVRINPLINFVWVGFALLVLGGAIAAFGVRSTRRKELSVPRKKTPRKNAAEEYVLQDTATKANAAQDNASVDSASVENASLENDEYSDSLDIVPGTLDTADNGE